jgi:hypothetical protein
MAGRLQMAGNCRTSKKMNHGLLQRIDRAATGWLKKPEDLIAETACSSSRPNALVIALWNPR